MKTYVTKRQLMDFSTEQIAQFAECYPNKNQYVNVSAFLFVECIVNIWNSNGGYQGKQIQMR